jgi:hypothetical protein
MNTSVFLFFVIISHTGTDVKLLFIVPIKATEKALYHSEPVFHSDALRAAFGGCVLHAACGLVRNDNSIEKAIN